MRESSSPPEATNCTQFVVSFTGMFRDFDPYTSQDGKTKGVNFAYYELIVKS